MITDQQLMQKNFEEKIKAFTYAVDGDFNSGAVFSTANTNIPTDTFNTLLVKSVISDESFAGKQELDRFIEKGYPFSVWMDVEHMNGNWKNILRNYNVKEAERNIVMKRENTLQLGERISGQLTIAEVKSDDTFLQYTEVFISLFAGTPEQAALESYFNKFSQIKLGSDVQLFIGCIEEMAVTTGLLIKGKDSYGIYDVMTKEDFRGQGFGSEMFQFLLSQTKDKQKPVVLQASDDGKNIYKRFGFREVGEMIVFE